MPTTFQKTVTVYCFSELNEKAKEKAKEDHFECFDYYMADEAMESLKQLAEYFGGRLKDWSFSWDGYGHSYAKFDMPNDMSRRVIQERLLELGDFNRQTLKGTGECKLTGCCTDEDAIDGFRIEFYRGRSTTMQRSRILRKIFNPKLVPGDLDALMQAAFKSWLKAQQANYLSEWEDENFNEMCEANNYWFTKHGKLTDGPPNKKEAI